MVRKIKFSFVKPFLALIVMVLVSVSGYSQNNPVFRVYENSSQQALKSSSLNAQVLPEDLLHGNNPTIYMANGDMTTITGPTKPLVLRADQTSLTALCTRDQLYSKVELITIKLNNITELNTPFDVGNIRGFSSLKYIYINCAFECTDQQISNFIINADSELIIYYKVLSKS